MILCFYLLLQTVIDTYKSEKQLEIMRKSLDSISPEDVVDIKVFKDEEVIKVFYPRVGGVVYITTKSKKFLTPVIQRYKENVEANKKRKKEGQIYIR